MSAHGRSEGSPPKKLERSAWNNKFLVKAFAQVKEAIASEGRMTRKSIAVLALALAALASAAPAHAQFSTAEANRYVGARDWNRALAYMQAWVKAKPDDAIGWYYLGNTYLLGLDRPADAIAPLQRATELKPGWADAWYHLGSAEVHADRPADAIVPLATAVKLDPENMRDWYMLGIAYNNARQFDQEFATLQEAERAAGPTTDFAGWYDLGLQYDSIHAYRQAVHAYRQAVHLKPDFGDGWNDLGLALRNLGALSGGNIGDFNEAQAAYRRAIQLGNQKAPSNLAEVKNIIAGANAGAEIRRDETPLFEHENNCYFHGRDTSSAMAGMPC